MNKILVTGASGFIGHHLVSALLRDGNNVIKCDLDFGDISEKDTWLKIPRVDIVIHLAGRTFVPDSWLDPLGFQKTNLIGTIAALEYCKKYDAKFITLSSYLYGNPDTLPVNELARLQPNNPYSLSKKFAEEACELYHKSFGLNIAILRPFNVYGIGQPNNFLIPSIIRQIIDGKTIQVNDLRPKRDYLYIYDLIDLIIKAIEQNQSFDIYNAGTGLSYSVGELIDIIQKLMNTNLLVESSNITRLAEIEDTKADISKANQYLDWYPQWSLHQGLSDLISKFL